MAGSASALASATDTNADTNADADEIMRLAIARFRSRMVAANQKFLQDRVNEIETKGLATEEGKRRRLREYRWMNYLEWDDDDPETRGNPGGIRIPQETSVADLDIPTILNALQSPEPVDGVLPPLLRTEQWRQMYLDTVQRVCQAQADAIVPEDEVELDVACNYHRDHRPMTIPRCDELALFLKYAQGVVDVDFRLSGIAPFTPAWSTGVKDEELDGLNEGQRRDKLADPELLKREQENLQKRLEYEVFNECLKAFVDEDLEVRAGFITGIGFDQRYACPSWYSAYAYCRLLTDDDEDDDVQDAANIRDWGWRVVVFQAEVVNPSVLYDRKARFDSIPEFLDWYASWLDHLDARGLLSLPRHAIGCETDCESDCEDH
ncbi:hypothetical protein Asppvi_005541 [Aspergillus pseudoviridinutans]|uniref:Uncharacterized protein n=1 Tax=Aspergillus pseudoviridinutans TaxID=1517512 RepID=A0A9P3ESV7_9EURO|nr:uncharacterized protein Asppvi_005541 [Aspergillus pseudoviridinutans]GIJ86649.1 hypothetical protein Asppvi_005541 [Aspergillus pseudoviridinutans]